MNKFVKRISNRYFGNRAAVDTLIEESQSKPFFHNYPSKVNIIDSTCRDGLQTFPNDNLTPLSLKYELLEKLSDCGIKTLEAGAFVNPKVSPNMANSGELFDQINNNLKPKTNKLTDGNVSYMALIGNKRGLLQCIEYGIDSITLVASSTNSHCKQNLNCDLETNINNVAEIIDIASKHNIFIRIALTCVFGCPFEGKIPPNIICNLMKSHINKNNGKNNYNFIIADTIGVGNPYNTYEMLNEINKQFGNEFMSNKIDLHFHNTMGQALANTMVGLQFGVTTYDTTLAGLGGPPSHYSYAKSTAGNLGTEDILYMLNSLDIETGINYDKVVKVSNWFQNELAQNEQKNKLQLKAYE